MTTIAVDLSFLRIVKASCSVTGNTAEQPAVVMVLTSQPVFVVVQRKWQIHFVTRSTKLCRFMQRLQKRLLVERRLRFHKLIVDPLQNRIVALRERIVNRFFDRVVCVPDVAVDVRNGMANCAGDPGLCGGMIQHVELRIVEGSAEERDWVMAARAEARALNRPIAFEGDFASFRDTGEIRRIVERAEAMSTLRPVIVRTLVALQTVVVHVQRFGIDEVSGRGTSQ